MNQLGIGISVTVFSKAAGWPENLATLLNSIEGVNASVSTNEGSLGNIVFFDESYSGVEKIIEKVDRNARAVFIVTASDTTIPEVLSKDLVDDVLVLPIRPVEVVGKLKFFQQVMMWSEVSDLNTSFRGIIEQLKDDLELATRLQKARMPNRFAGLKGVGVQSKYMAGVRTGGDYFDLVPSADQSQLSMILSDSSSYGLSSSVLTVIIKIAMNIASERGIDTEAMVKNIINEVALTLGEKDKLSLFFGVLNRARLELSYINFGHQSLFYIPKDGSIATLDCQGAAISQGSDFKNLPKPALLGCMPDDRLLVVSDGVVEELGDNNKIINIAEKFRNAPGSDLVNELVFQIKNKVSQRKKTFPAQDCSVSVLEIPTNVVKLKRV